MLATLLMAAAAVAPADPSNTASPAWRVVVRESVAPDLAPAELVRLEARILAELEAESIATAEGVARTDARACQTQLCRSRAGEAYGITHWVRAEIDREDRDYHVRVSAGRMSDGVTVAQSDGACPICGSEDVAKVLAAHTAHVVARLEHADDSPPPPPVLAPPRPRTVSSPARPPLRPPGIALLVAGSFAGIAGAVLLGIDGRPVGRRCAATSVDADGDCRYVHATLAGGIVLVTGGVLAVASGVTLLTIARGRRVAVLSARLGLGRLAIAGRF